MAEYNIDMYMTIKVTDLIIEADSEEEAKKIAREYDPVTLVDLDVNMEVDEIYDIEVDELSDDIDILSPDEIDDIFDELVNNEQENFEENQEFSSLADDYEEFSDYLIDQGVYDSQDRQKLWTKFKIELDKIVNEFTSLADEEE